MPQGNCDPASKGLEFNLRVVQIGPLIIEIRYGWDGVSTFETGCDGPIVNAGSGQNRWAVHAQNPSTTDYYVHTRNKQGNPKVYPLPAGADVTLSAQQASSSGYNLISDFDDIVFSTEP